MKTSHEYIEGYKKCMDDLEKALNDSIHKHNGATNLLDSLNVLNDIILFTHRKSLTITPWEDNYVIIQLGIG